MAHTNYSPDGFDSFGGVAGAAFFFSGTATIFGGLFKALPGRIASITSTAADANMGDRLRDDGLE